MCMIIYKPEGVRPPSMGQLLGFMDRNPHGFGGVLFDDPHPSPVKTLGRRTALDWLSAAPSDPAWLLHFRYATCGRPSVRNCHPWRVGGSQFFFAHNGTLDGYGHDGLTDSECFLGEFVEPRFRGVRSLARLGDSLSPYSQGSRFIVTDGRTTLIAGDWHLHPHGWLCSKPLGLYRREWFSYPVFHGVSSSRVCRF